MAWFTASMGSSNKEMGNHQFAIGAAIGARPEQLLILLSLEITFLAYVTL
jgi:hypothetical protein